MCYARARTHERRGQGFDPTYRKRGRSPAIHPPCKNCGSSTHYYAVGLCRTCYARAQQHRQRHGVFDPQRLIPVIPVVTGLKPAVLGLLRLLMDMPQEIEGRRFAIIGQEIASKTGVSRQRIHGLLLKLSRRRWISFSIRLNLPPDVEAYVRAHTEEEERDALDTDPGDADGVSGAADADGTTGNG